MQSAPLRSILFYGLLTLLVGSGAYISWQHRVETSPLALAKPVVLQLAGRTLEIRFKEIGRLKSTPVAEVNPALAKKFAAFGKEMDPVTPLAESQVGTAPINSTLIPKVAQLSVEQKADLNRLRESPQGISEYVGNGESATVRMLAGNDLANSDPANPESPQQLTARFFAQNKALLRLKNPAEELLLVREEVDKQIGTKVLRFNQQFAGLEVWPAQVLTNTSAQGYLTVVTGAYVPTPEGLELTPTIQPNDATLLAYQHLGLAVPTKSLKPVLKIYSDQGKAQEIAYEVQVEGGQRDSQVFIGARSGKVLASISKICTDGPVAGNGVGLMSATALPLNLYQVGTNYFAYDATKVMYNGTVSPPTGFIKVTDSSGSLLYSTSRYGFSDPEAASALYSLGKTYDFYKTTFGRNSWDGSGGSLIGVVRVKNPNGTLMYNAFWDGQKMSFGSADKFAGALDVVGHELTHGVVSATAGLVYLDQSGAINESFADIFGEGVEDYVTGGLADWKIGTGLNPFLRDMVYPEAYQQPSVMSHFVITTTDSGGVHANSGIPNHAFYLYTIGLAGGGVGRVKAQQVFYRALTTKLTATSTFLDLRLAVVKSAEELYGVGGTEAIKAKAAFDAVEIFEPATSINTSPADYRAVVGADSYIYMYPSGSYYYMARRETALDGAYQNWVCNYATDSGTRPSISGDGSKLVFVTSSKDLAIVNTSGNSNSVLGYPGYFNSAATSPDGAKMACIMRNVTTGIIESSVFYIHGGTSEVIPLSIPMLDGTSATSFAAVDELDFSPDGNFLAFDGYSTSVVDGVTISGWSIYILDLKSKAIYSLIQPFTDVQFRRPSFSRIGAFRLAFEPIETSYRYVAAWDLLNGVVKSVKQLPNLGYPLYPRYSAADDKMTYTDSYLYNGNYYPIQAYIKMLSDHVSPDTSQLPFAVQYDGKNGQSYRRGTYYGTPQVTVTALTSTVKGGQVGTFRITRLSGDQTLRVPISYKTIGTATPGVHFTRLNALVDLPANTTSVDIPLTSLMGVGVASKTVTLSIDPQSNYTTPDNPTAATMTLTEASQTYDQWVATMGGVVLTKTGDYDGDGFSNLFEYAVGGDPRVPGDASQQVSVVQVSSLNYLQVRVPRALVRSNIAWSLERSVDMVTWTSASSVVVSNTVYEIILRDSSPIAAGERRFIRVRVDEQ